MKENIKPGLTFEYEYIVPNNKTVPCLYPESPEFQVMPQVFATGYLVGLFEWACILAIKPYIDWPAEQSVGTSIKVSHQAASPPGLTVTVKVTLLEVNGRRLVFSVIAHDGIDMVSEGTHERFIINAAKFNAKAEKKAK